MKRNKMVLIDWNDTGVVHGWQCHEDIEDNIAHCQTIGFCLKDDENGITLALSISDQGLVMEKITIPKGCILDIKELRVK